MSRCRDLCDLKLPDIDGLEILRRCRQVSPQSVFVMITAYGTVETAVEAMKIGAFDFLEKPFSYDRLLDVVKRSLDVKKSCAMVPEESFPPPKYPVGFDQIVGTSPCMQEVYGVIESTVAPARGEWITPDDLPANINGRRRGISADFSSPLKEARQKLLSSFEREYLISVLTENEWNISRTARFCGVNRRTLQRLLKKYEIIFREPDELS
ncbi:MAG: response regulator [Acidobacteriota bacterium]